MRKAPHLFADTTPSEKPALQKISTDKRNALIAQLYKLLKQQNQCFEEALLPALQGQFQCLTQLDSHNLVSANQKASHWIQFATKNQTSIQRIVQHLGATSDKIGLNSIADQLPPQLKARFKRLINILSVRQSQCHALNERNGELLSRQTQLIQSLLGQQPEQYAPRQGFL